MEITFLNIFLYNIFSQLLLQSVWLFGFIMLCQKRMRWKKGIPIAAIGTVVSGIAATWMYLSGNFNILFSTLLFDYLGLGLQLLTFWVFTKERIGKLLILLGISYFILQNSELICAALDSRPLDLTVQKDFISYALIELLAFPALGMALFWILKKMQFPQHLGALMKTKTSYFGLMVLAFFLPGFYEVYKLNMYNFKNQQNIAIFGFLFLLLGVIILKYLMSDMVNRAKAEANEAMVLQQQDYVQHLEKIQKDMRVFRHDYKNMLSSMYLYAKNGENEHIQDFIQKMTLDFDNQVGEEIRQTTQMSNLYLLELKSLLLSKFTVMRKREIPFYLEVVSPIEKVDMDLGDYCRCIGILLDNAMEAAKEANGRVEVLMSRQEKSLTVIVRNRSKKPQEFYRIGEWGYSTKGEGRGLGLYSYGKIIESYYNVFTSLNYKDDWFTQELKVVDL